jgi:hypothetical protein
MLNFANWSDIATERQISKVSCHFLFIHHAQRVTFINFCFIVELWFVRVCLWKPLLKMLLFCLQMNTRVLNYNEILRYQHRIGWEWREREKYSDQTPSQYASSHQISFYEELLERTINLVSS